MMNDDKIGEGLSELESRRQVRIARRWRVRVWKAAKELRAQGIPALTHALDGTGAFCRVGVRA